VQIEAIMNDFIQLEPQSNLFEAETMMEGEHSSSLYHWLLSSVVSNAMFILNSFILSVLEHLCG
jgi:hypothetical protein